MKKGDWINIALLILVLYLLNRVLTRGTNLKRFDGFLNELKAMGYNPVIRESLRTFKQQQIYYQQDKRNARPGHSAHEKGLAIDLDIHKGGKVLSKHSPRAQWINTGIPEIAKQYGIRWGGNFKGYADNNHFYYTQ